MAKLVTGLFNTRSSAMLAIEDMMRHGFAQDDISLMMTDSNIGREFFTDLATKAPEGGLAGAIIGAIIGGIITGLMRVGYISDVGLGVTTVTTAIAVLAGVGLGGLLGLIIGAMIGAAIPEYELNMYRNDRRGGGILVGVYTHTRREGEVRRLLEAAGGHRIRARNIRDEKLPATRTRDYVPAGDVGRDREAL